MQRVIPRELTGLVKHYGYKRQEFLFRRVNFLITKKVQHSEMVKSGPPSSIKANHRIMNIANRRKMGNSSSCVILPPISTKNKSTNNSQHATYEDRFKLGRTSA